MLKSGLSFLPPFGAKKKYVPCILKYKAHILKFKARIFGCLQTRMNKGFAPNVKCGQKQPPPVRRSRNCGCCIWKAGSCSAILLFVRNYQ